MMLTLVIDVCSDRGVAALVEGGKVNFCSGLPFGLHNSRYLVPKIEEGLKSIGIESKEIDLIAVGIGPGSYTGMRVGSVVAKAMSFAHKTPLVGVTSLEGYLPDHDGPFAAMIDARMAGCYLLKGEKRGDEVVYQSKPEVWTIEHVGAQLEGIGTIVSPNAVSLKEKFKVTFPNKQWEWQESAIDVQYFASRAEKKYHNGEFSTDGTLDLLYMR